MLAVAASNPAVHVRFFLLAFGALGRKSQRAQKGELCAAALAEVASLEVGRGSLFSPTFFDACFAVYDARRLLGSKTWISATLQMPVLASQALATDPFPRFFQARPARKLRLTDPKCLFRRDPDFADAPETAQDGGFRHHFATACVFADFRPSTCRPRPKAPIAHEYWLRNVAALACCFAPQGHLLALKRAHMGNSAYVLS